MSRLSLLEKANYVLHVERSAGCLPAQTAMYIMKKFRHCEAIMRRLILDTIHAASRGYSSVVLSSPDTS